MNAPIELFIHNPEIVEILIEAGMPLMFGDKHIFIWTMIKRKPAIFEICLKKGIDPNTVDHTGKTILQHAMAYDICYTEMLLDYNVDIKAKDKMGRTALEYAVWLDKMNHARLLIQHGADPDDMMGSLTLLESSVCSSRYAMSTLLISEGATVTYHALEYAVRENNVPLVKLLLSRNPPMFTDKDGNTILHIAYLKPHKDVISALLKAGADLDAVNNDGLRPVDLR